MLTVTVLVLTFRVGSGDMNKNKSVLGLNSVRKSPIKSPFCFKAWIHNHHYLIPSFSPVRVVACITWKLSSVCIIDRSRGGGLGAKSRCRTGSNTRRGVTKAEPDTWSSHVGLVPKDSNCVLLYTHNNRNKINETKLLCYTHTHPWLWTSSFSSASLLNAN